MVAGWSHITKHHRESGIDHYLYCDLYFVRMHVYRKWDGYRQSRTNGECQLNHHLHGTKCHADRHTINRWRHLFMVPRWSNNTKHHREPGFHHNVYGNLYFVRMHVYRNWNGDRQSCSNS